MTVPARTYISQLNVFKNDLNILMKDWPPGSIFNAAKSHAEAIAPLIADVTQQLEKAVAQNANQAQLLQKVVLPITSDAKISSLRAELEKLRNLMVKGDEKKKFAEYDAMLDSLINDGAAA